MQKASPLLQVLQARSMGCHSGALLKEQLEEGTVQFQPVKRVYIEKKNGKLRPLGLPTWNDKLLQEVIRIILEAYYEPQFSKYSHGFRLGQGCHTALDEIRKRWKGVKWFIRYEQRLFR